MLILVADCYGRLIRFPLTEQYNEVTVGSLPENHIYLPYRGISKKHFSLIRKGAGWLLRDSGSTNGTRLNGKMITEAVIKPEDVIHTGIVELKVKESGKDELIEIPGERVSRRQMDRTDKVSSIAQDLQQSVFAPGKLIFPEGMIQGKSTLMVEIYQRLNSLAASDINVLLIGETGTGKEMLARMLHLSGKRASDPFIAVNCAAIPSELLESELFGIGERVATDVSKRKGKIEMADRGTLFLDELGAFPIGLQAKILRAIEEKAVTPVGEHRPIAVDFRLITAMNEDPHELIKHGKLREDLYHRVATVEMTIPALRERSEDIPILLIGLVQQISRKEQKPVAGISKRLFSLLAGYSYPGNVRELFNLVSSIVALAHPGEILDVHLAPGKLLQQAQDPELDAQEPDLRGGSLDLRGKLDAMSKRLIMQALHLHSWNLSAAAKALGVTRFGLRKMMKRLSIPLKKET